MKKLVAFIMLLGACGDSGPSTQEQEDKLSKIKKLETLHYEYDSGVVEDIQRWCDKTNLIYVISQSGVAVSPNDPQCVEKAK